MHKFFLKCGYNSPMNILFFVSDSSAHLTLYKHAPDKQKRHLQFYPHKYSSFASRTHIFYYLAKLSYKYPRRNVWPTVQSHTESTRTAGSVKLSSRDRNSLKTQRVSKSEPTTPLSGWKVAQHLIQQVTSAYRRCCKFQSNKIRNMFWVRP